MFKRIRNYFSQRRISKVVVRPVVNNLAFRPAAQAQKLFEIRGDDEEYSILFTGNNGEEIFSITQSGEARWLKEDSYNEAAELFLTYMTMNIENAAGIRQNRLEWEERIAKALISEAKNTPLGPKELTNVIRKCIMYDKLKGIK